MDANRIPNISIMKKGISKGNYEITGILKTGELVITLLDDIEKDYLKKVVSSNKSKEEKLSCVKKLMATRGRPANELLQVYKQNICCQDERSPKNGLRLR